MITPTCFRAWVHIPSFQRSNSFRCKFLRTYSTLANKILRGCEYWLANGRIIEPPYEIRVFLPKEMPQDVLRSLLSDYLGPGCRIRRAGAVDDPCVAMYEIVIWDSWTICDSTFASEVCLSVTELVLPSRK
jgi:hypothetical protein